MEPKSTQAKINEIERHLDLCENAIPEDVKDGMFMLRLPQSQKDVINAIRLWISPNENNYGGEQ